MTEPQPTIVVGVVPEQPVDVLHTAALFAQRFGARLVCATVDQSSVAAGGLEGAWAATMIDSQFDERLRETMQAELHAQVARSLADHDVVWEAQALIGGAAAELDALAERLDAQLIVLGTREPGIRGSLHELINGSVAAQLAHRQHRPVLVVPLNPDAIEARR